MERTRAQMDIIEAHFDALTEKVLAQNPAADFGRIRRAYEMAAAAHAPQVRKEGTPFIGHPIATASIIVEMGLDEDSIVAALLHDTIEDSDTTAADIEAAFGASVAAIVEGVTKLSRVQYTSKEEEQMENLRKMLMAMARDIRVIMIKIADRLHNMRTMQYLSPKKQLEKASETMRVYAPIAHRLGMQKIKWELEDLAFYYLDKAAYEAITQDLDARRDVIDTFIERIQGKIAARMTENGIAANVSGRLKHMYSIYRKMYSQHKTFEEVFDLCALRVIVDDIATCYAVLGHIHDMYNNLPNRFKDYISTAKPNGYQSLHTTVLGEEGMPFEVQIRTWNMHHTAEYGVAAHWKYKSGSADMKQSDEERFAWVRRLLESQQDVGDAQDFFHDLRIDMFADEVFIFTPNGDVLNLPAGSCPIDFAYSIHSAVGNRMTGAKVNGRLVTIDHTLENGDIVEIITSGHSKGPSRDWMKLVKSSEARNKIRQWFKKERRDENIIHGKSAFEAEMRRQGLSMDAVTRTGDTQTRILARLGIGNMDDAYAAIGYGGMSAQKTVGKVRDVLLQIAKPGKGLVERINEAKTPQKTKPVRGIIVEGVDNCLVKFSRCCAPVPGDLVVGFITRGYGVSVHRQDCVNHLNAAAKSEEAGRWIPVRWAEASGETYQTNLVITARDRDGLVLDVATALTAMKVRVRHLSGRAVGNGGAVVFISLHVADLKELQNAINKLSGISGVQEITRNN